MKISYFIFLGFLLILILFATTTYINFRQSGIVNENSEFFAKSTLVVRNTNRFQRNMLNMVSGLRGYLFTGERYFIEAYDSAAQENEEILKELFANMQEASPQQKTLAEIQQLNNQWLTEFAEPLILAKKESMLSKKEKNEFADIYRQKLNSGIENKINRAMQYKVRDLSNYEYDLRDLRKKNLDESIRQTRTVSVYLTSFSILIGLAVAVFLAYRISTGILSMVHMANNIAAGNYAFHMQETGTDELTRLAHSLNTMASTLSENITLLKRKNAELDQFAHIVSHDLKAPLRGIANVVTWIEEDHNTELSPKMREYIDLIKKRTIRAENLIRGILSYSRVGRTSRREEIVDLNLMLREISETVPLKPGMTLDLPIGLPWILSERVPLQQVLSNLIDNAIKYHDKPQGKITVRFADHPRQYQFFVEDDGPGIARTYHDKIFGMFQTLQERDETESTGIGLAIVKKILDDRDQHIELTSEPGKGSIFMFTWPKIIDDGKSNKYSISGR